MTVSRASIKVSASVLPAGAAAESWQVIGCTSLDAINAKLTAPLAVTAAALPLPAGAATSAAQATGNASLASIDGKLANPLPVTAAALPLPAGAATSAAQATGNASLASIDGKLTAPLAISAAALPLPAGAGTSANQATANASLASIDTKVTGLATAAAQTTGNASLASIDTKLSNPLPVQTKTPGRVRCVFSFAAVAPAVADTLLTLSKNLAGVVTTGTTFAVTAGKNLRITAVAFSLKAGAAAAAFGTMTLRSLAGAVLIGSPSLLRLDVGSTAAVIGGAGAVVLDIPDGMEFSGTDQIGVSLAAQAITNIASISLVGYEYTP